MAACPVGQHVNYDDPSSCLPNSAPLPPGTVELATDAVCPIDGDLEHPDPNNEDVFTFTEPTQMKTFVECILPEAVGVDDLRVRQPRRAHRVGRIAGDLADAQRLPLRAIRRAWGVNGEGCRGEDEDGNQYRYNDVGLGLLPVGWLRLPR